MGITAGLIDDDNLYRWKITILGPKDTSYGNEVFLAEIIFPKLYPEEAPKIKFKTPIYHPNVNNRKSSNNLELGEVTFKDINNWKASYNIKEVLTKLYSILYYPNLDLTYSLEIAKEYKENKNLFEKKAKYFTKKYSNRFKDIKGKEYEYWDFSCDENKLNSMKMEQNKNIIKTNKNYDGNQLITLVFDFFL